MSLFVDRLRAAQTRCQTCGQPIDRGMWRIVDAAESHHFACLVVFDRERVKAALISTETTDAIAKKALEVFWDRGLSADVNEGRARRVASAGKRITPLDDPLALELLGRLDAEPGDRALLAVLGDHLQQRGDERGELIALDLAASPDPTVSARRRELTTALTPLLDRSEKAILGVGFVRELHLWADRPLADRADVLAHPACRLLHTLTVIVRAEARMSALPIAPGCLPRGLHALSISGAPIAAGDLGWLPCLASLDVQSGEPVRHPTLRTLTLRDADHDHVAAHAAGLPAVTTLRLAAADGDAVAALVATRWLARLDELELFGHLDHAMLIETLGRGLAGRRLGKLVLHVGDVSRRTHDQLAALCDALECWCPELKVFAPVRRLVEHATKPEWGRGTLVREANGKVEIQFADAVRTFKADAPFLRWLEG